MTTDLITLSPHDPNERLLQGVTNKDTKQALKTFKGWLDRNRQHWLKADLTEYKAWLETHTTEKRPRPLSASSVNAYMSAVRRRYAAVAISNTFRDELFATAPGNTFSQQKAFVDEIVTRIKNNADPDNTKVKQVVSQSSPDAHNIRLTFDEALYYVQSFETQTLEGRLNTAFIALLFATGLRIDELCSAWASDLYHTLDGKPALFVRKAKNSKQRTVIYEPRFEPFYDYVWRYLDIVGRSDEQPLFSRFTSRHYKELKITPMSVRRAEEIIKGHPAYVNNRLVSIHAHRTRHSYARIMYREFGYPVEYISYQMGHLKKNGVPNIAMTLEYIGINKNDPRLGY